MTIKFSSNINSNRHHIDGLPMKRRFDVLHKDLRLTGTKDGSKEGECGACLVFIKKVVSAADVGIAINPVLTKGQIEGGTLQALGYGMMEEVIMKNGKMANDRLTNYMLPTCMDAPETDVILIEKPYPHGPFGAKGVGELPMDGAAPALAAAICNALHIEITELPFTPERLLQALEFKSSSGAD